jgi:hypothetical protein
MELLVVQTEKAGLELLTEGLSSAYNQIRVAESGQRLIDPPQYYIDITKSKVELQIIKWYDVMREARHLSKSNQTISGAVE